MRVSQGSQIADRIHAVICQYNGVVFRSKTEAKFARWCDEWKIRWDYEPEVLEFGNCYYCPDFWLPDQKTLVEIKPAVFLQEAWKIDKLSQELRCQDYGPDWGKVMQGEFTLWVGVMERFGFEVLRLWKNRGWELPPDIRAFWCKKCGKPHVVGLGEDDCRACGSFDPDKRGRYLGYFNGEHLPDNVIPSKSWRDLCV